jgi:hypothetical protein
MYPGMPIEERCKEIAKAVAAWGAENGYPHEWEVYAEPDGDSIVATVSTTLGGYSYARAETMDFNANPIPVAARLYRKVKERGVLYGVIK